MSNMETGNCSKVNPDEVWIFESVSQIHYFILKIQSESTFPPTPPPPEFWLISAKGINKEFKVIGFT